MDSFLVLSRFASGQEARYTLFNNDDSVLVEMGPSVVKENQNKNGVELAEIHNDLPIKQAEAPTATTTKVSLDLKYIPDDDLAEYLDPEPPKERRCKKHRFVLLAIVMVLFCLLVAMALAGEELHERRTTITRQINAVFEPSWQSDNWTIQALLVVEHTYTTLNPSNPYYNDPQSSDHVISMYRVEDINAMHTRKLIMRFNEDTSNHGSLQYSHLYYLPFSGRFLCSYRGTPSLMKFYSEPDAAERDALGINRNWKNVFTTFSLSSSEATLLFGAVQQNYQRTLLPRNPVPSPNSHLVAIVVTAADTEDGVVFHYKTAVTFYDLRNQLFLGGRTLVLQSDQIELQLIPSVWNNVTTEPYFCLWRTDSTGVYVLDRSDAWFVQASSPYSYQKTATVPRDPIPTVSTIVNDQGVAAIIQISGNNATIQFSYVPNWVPFSEVPLIPHGTETYSELVPGKNYTLIKN